MNELATVAGLIVAGIVGIVGIGVAFFFTVRRDLRKWDRRACFEALKWGAKNPGFTEETRRECRDALHRMAEGLK